MTARLRVAVFAVWSALLAATVMLTFFMAYSPTDPVAMRILLGWAWFSMTLLIWIAIKD